MIFLTTWSVSRMLGDKSGCPEGCGYLKDGDNENDTWCFREGPYIPQYACSSATTGLATTTVNMSLQMDLFDFLGFRLHPVPRLRYLSGLDMLRME